MIKNFNLLIRSKNFTVLLFAIAFACVLFFSVWVNFVNNKEEAQASPKTNEITEQIKECNEIRAKTAENYNLALMQVEESESKINAANENLSYCNARIPECQSYIGMNMNRVYKNGEVSLTDILLNATSLQGFLRSFEYFETINKKQADSIKELSELKKQAEIDKEICLTEHAQIMVSYNAAAAAKAEADAAYETLQSALAQATEEDKEAARPKPAPESPWKRHVDVGGDWGWIASIALSMCDGTHMYRWGGIGPDSFDCSGFVSYCINGGVPGRRGTTRTFLGYAECKPTPGCICVNEEHCGIYLGNGSMAHAPCDDMAVQVGSVLDGMVYRAPF